MRLLILTAAVGGVDSPFVVRAVMQSQQANATATGPDVTKLGPQVGDKVPDFGLPDQHGQTRTLASLMGPKGLVLVFNRSADW
jgi:hypothetical protein